MIRGAALAFYESASGGGRSAIVAIGRIVDVTSVLKDATSEQLQRGGVVGDLKKLTKLPRILASTFDNLVRLERPVPLNELREIGCADGANFVTATSISWAHLLAIVNAGFPNEPA